MLTSIALSFHMDVSHKANMTATCLPPPTITVCVNSTSSAAAAAATSDSVSFGGSQTLLAALFRTLLHIVFHPVCEGPD